MDKELLFIEKVNQWSLLRKKSILIHALFHGYPKNEKMQGSERLLKMSIREAFTNKELDFIANFE